MSCMHGENDNRNNNGIDIGKTAVAIEYVPGEAAPKILATGKGVIADKIIERAKESNVPTYKDGPAASISTHATPAPRCACRRPDALTAAPTTSAA